ncbi:MAG: DUF6249 domain-containing protein [Bacteroides sp.]|nr:DUF6249 domain-containing protein [Bacteroides sp.]
MKRIIILTLIATAFFAQVFGQEKTTAKQVVTTETQSTSVDAKKGDTVVITEWEDSEASAPKGSKKKNEKSSNSDFSDFPFDLGSMAKGGIVISLISIILIFGLPFFVIFIAFYFRYKNRKAKYQLIEKALESGQPLPENLVIDGPTNKDLQGKGIKNAFTGLGLFIFLWAITGNFGVGSIGLLVLFTGVGQIFIARSQDSDNKKKNDRSEF